MKWLFAVTFACAVIAIGTPAEAQSKFDICSAYGRDAMMAFYPSSAVPVTMATRSREARRSRHYAIANTKAAIGAPAANSSVGSHQSYFKECMAQ
jgi:hypothetical protein